MSLRLQLDYWKLAVRGPLAAGPRRFSQGTTLEELEENIRDAYRMMLDAQESGPVAAGAI